MKAVAVRVGPLELQGCQAVLSSLRWLRDDGHVCKPGEVFAYCNVSFRAVGKAWGADRPFADERRDLQLAFSTPMGGRLRVNRTAEAGGFYSFMAHILWHPELVLATIETDDAASAPPFVDAGVLLCAGRRVTEAAEVRMGLLTGWHARSRAGHVPQQGLPGTLLSMGICELEPVLKGDSHAFLEFLAQAPGPAQVVFSPDRSLVPCARIVAEQLTRTEDERQAIAASFMRIWADGRELTAGTMLRAGSTLDALLARPLSTPLDVLTRSGLRRVEQPDAVLLSVRAERTLMLRHKKLGYTLALHIYHLEETGEAFRQWLRSDFERLPRTLADIERDYEALIGLFAKRLPGTQLVISNMVSTGKDDLASYAHLPDADEDRLESVLAKDTNLMLASLAKRRGIAVLDIDAVAVELGVAEHSFDGTHHDGAMGAGIRAELLDVLAARKVPGFVAQH